MDTAPFHIFLEEDRRLEPGSTVTAFWRREGWAYRARGIITGIDRQSVTVRLREAADGSGRYPSGALVSLPRFCDHTAWTSDNCVRLHFDSAHPLALSQSEWRTARA